MYIYIGPFWTYQMRVVALLAALLLNLTGPHASSCPLEIEPPRVVVPYGGSFSVLCRALTPLVENIAVEAAHGKQDQNRIQNVTWSFEQVDAWDIVASCFVNLLPSSNYTELQCQNGIPVTVYKYPQNVTITDTEGGSDAGELDEGILRVFRCDVNDVAPAENIIVTWLIGNKIVLSNHHLKGSKDLNDTKKPRDVTSLFSYEPRREDDGLQIRCQVDFNLGPSGPQKPQTSQGLSLRIRYPPEKITQLEDTELEVGSSGTLKCFSDAYPAPTYHWDYYKTGNVQVMDVPGGSHLHINKTTDVNIGNYTCIVANDLKNISKMARVTVKGANSQCPITITPERLVMPYGNQKSVLCENSNEDASRNVIALNWRVDHHIVPGPRLFLDKVLVWDPRAECIGTFSGIGKCSKPFDVTFYKTADSVSIHSINHTGPMLADEEYQLQCDIVNVAPVQNLTVRWYQGDDLLKDQGSLRVTGCPHQNKVECDNQVIRSPVNASSTITVRLGRNPDGAQFRCEAQLALEGQPPPPTNSSVLSLSVHYEPIINRTKLPLRLQVFKGRPTELVCEADGRPAPNIHWVSEKGVRVSGGNLRVTEAGVWTCNATNVVGSSSRAVEVTVLVKETADQVLIHPLGHTGPMLADKEYQLQCDIVNVAPVQNLIVRWYQDDDLLKDQGSLRVTGCPHQNKVECDNQVIRSPVNVSSTITVRLGRNPDGAQFRCEAQLALEQQPPPPMMFHLLHLSVHYKPIINKKPESKVPVFKGYPVELVCEADGRPVADIHWYSAKGDHVSGGNLTAIEAGVWTCNATNVVGYSDTEVEVVMKEDYLPLIAGFVAATVLIISAVFIFFYSIYYKNTKMRRYSLKNPKPSVLNGNVAHNSWDSQLPMTKLS